MPGSSLWLVPPPDSALHKQLSTLITSSIPAIFPIALPVHFSPHITLTADTILRDPEEPQTWLDNLELPENVNQLKATLQEPQVGEAFFRKLTLKCGKSDELKALAAACRKAGTGMGDEEVGEWVEGSYGPHLSLLYSDLPQEEINAKLDAVRTTTRISKQEHEDATTANGAEIWLVPTHKDIADWQPIAIRKLEGVEWSWEA